MQQDRSGNKYVSLYRKYRPATFKEVIGQEHVVSTLSNQVKTGQISHAYLFTGARGTGKTSCAKIFAKAVNCLNPVDGSPCLECSVCKMLANPNNMDVVEIDAASNNSVEDIRLMRENVKFSPVNARYKVYIIDEVHMLSPSAFNALLKTLEEPPEHIIFILATTEVHKIPATILSRTTRLDFRLVGQEVMQAHLKDIFSRENITCDEQSLSEIARLSEGCVRDALSISECVVGYAGKQIEYDDVLTCLGTSSRQELLALGKSMMSKNVGEFFNEVDALYKKGKNFSLLAKEVVSFFRDAIICKTTNNAQEILALPQNEFNEIKEFADNSNYEDLFFAMSEYLGAENDFRYATSAKMLFESVGILCMCDEEVKKNEEVRSEEECSGREIWGKLMTYAVENEYYAMHALIGGLSEFEKKDGKVIGITHEQDLPGLFKKFAYDKLTKTLMGELGLKSEIAIEYRERVLTRDERVDKKLKEFFLKFFDYHIDIEQSLLH